MFGIEVYSDDLLHQVNDGGEFPFELVMFLHQLPKGGAFEGRRQIVEVGDVLGFSQGVGAELLPDFHQI